QSVDRPRRRPVVRRARPARRPRSARAGARPSRRGRDAGCRGGLRRRRRPPPRGVRDLPAAGLLHSPRVLRPAALRDPPPGGREVRGAAHPPVSKKLILVVIDGAKPAMLDRTVADGRAPILELLIDRGTYVRNVVAVFPSVTPVCAASIVTGVGQDRHLIPSMNWFHRGEGRYVEYGSSFRASRRFGLARQL